MDNESILPIRVLPRREDIGSILVVIEVYYFCNLNEVSEEPKSPNAMRHSRDLLNELLVFPFIEPFTDRIITRILILDMVHIHIRAHTYHLIQ